MTADATADGDSTDGSGGGPAAVRFRIDLRYDGTAFSGWAAQPGRRTVEAELAAVVARRPPVPGTPGRLVVAGRTDAGVHARGQVVHVDVVPAPGTTAEPARVVRAWNRMLDGDVRVARLSAAPPGFDARFAAVWRRYTYRIADAAAPVDPLLRTWTTPHHRVLDTSAMAEAAGRLLGRHDFAAFCRPKPGATTIRTLELLRVTRTPAGVVEVDVRADAFCHSMVRALVGALLAVGDVRRPPDWPAAVLAAGVRDPGVGVAPARGLVLEEVGYPDDAGLAARVARTRAVRDPADVEPVPLERMPLQPVPVEPVAVVAGSAVPVTRVPPASAGAPR